MLRLLSFLRAYRTALLFLFLLLTGVLFAAFPGAAPARFVRGAVLGLLSYPLSSAGRPLGGREPSADEYRELRRTCLELALENSYLRERERENLRLRRLLGLKEKSRYTFLPVEVIGTGPDVNVNSVIIRGGGERGLKADMPVVVAEGLVGKVTDVSWNSAVVQLLRDQNARVSAVVQRSRVPGIIEWAGGDRCLLKNVTKRDDVEAGDLVITSGQGGVYPKGITVGTVTRIDADVTGLFKRVEVALAVDFSYPEELFILVDE